MVFVFAAYGSVRRVILEQGHEVVSEVAAKIKNCCSDGLCVKEVKECGRGLFATKKFLEGDFICVYTGELITDGEFRKRYGDSLPDRCYTFHFQHDSKKLVCDATNDDGSVARMANHSWKLFNARMERIVVDTQPRVVMFAEKDIQVGDEIRYNYGDRVVKESAGEYPWLAEIKEYNKTK